MKKKGKLFLSLCTLLFSLGVMCFGVYSAVQVQFNVNGSINYVAPDAEFNTAIYTSAMLSSEDLIKSSADNYKTLGIGNIPLPLAKDENGEPYIYTTQASYPENEGEQPEYSYAEFNDINLDFNDSNCRIYYIVINIKPTEIMDNYTVQATIENNTPTGNNLGHYETNTALTFTEANVGQNVVIAFWVKDSSQEILAANLDITITLTNVQASVNVEQITVGKTPVSGTLTLTKDTAVKLPTTNIKIQPNANQENKRTEITLNLKSSLPNYARMFVNYNKSTNTDIKVNASSLYLKDSGVYKIYVDNYSSSAVDLDDLNISILFDVQTELLHYDNDNQYYYVEMGTQMRDGETKNEYLKWKLVGVGDGGYDTFDKFTDFDSATGRLGAFVLESYIDVNSPDGSGRKLNEVAFANYYNNMSTHLEEEWVGYQQSANDYGQSTVARYLNGVDVYKGSISGDNIFIPEQTINTLVSTYAREPSTPSKPDPSSHYSNMYTDFNIDIEHDLVYQLIEVRQTYEICNENGAYYPPVYVGIVDNYFWLLSYKNVSTFFDNDKQRMWHSTDYWLSSPAGGSDYSEQLVDSNGQLYEDGYDASSILTVRPAFCMPLQK